MILRVRTKKAIADIPAGSLATMFREAAMWRVIWHLPHKIIPYSDLFTDDECAKYLEVIK